MTRRSQLILAEARGTAARDISTPSSLYPGRRPFMRSAAACCDSTPARSGSTRPLSFSTAPIQQISSTSYAANSACRRPRHASPARTPVWRSTIRRRERDQSAGRFLRRRQARPSRDASTTGDRRNRERCLAASARHRPERGGEDRRTTRRTMDPGKGFFERTPGVDGV